MNTIIVHSTDAGRTWTEVPQSQQYTDPDGRLAFSFLDAAHGWVSTWGIRGGEPEMIVTRDGGQHWQRASQQFLQSMQFVDDTHGYGTMADEFFRTDDGGRSWVETKIPDIVFIDRMVFQTSDKGWIASIYEKDFLVFRTVNGGKDWEESRMTPPHPPERIRDLFFLDQQHGWLTIWSRNGGGTGLYSTVDGGKHWTPDPSFQAKDMPANLVRFTSRETGFVFGASKLAYTTDGGAHWRTKDLPGFIMECQVFAGDLMCSAGPGFRLLTIHPK